MSTPEETYHLALLVGGHDRQESACARMRLDQLQKNDGSEGQ